MSARLLELEDGPDELRVVRSDFWGFNAIGVASGGRACVVDPGIRPGDMQLLRDSLDGRVEEIVLTHSHHDHIRGWMRFPGARVTMPRIAAEKPQDSRDRILRAKRRIDEKLGVDDRSYEYPHADHVFDEHVAFELGELTVEAHFVPGHSNCTSVVLFPELATLCTADYLVSPGLPYCRWEARAFEEATRTLRELCRERGVRRILPAHNAPIHGTDAIEAAFDEELSYFEVLRVEVERLHAEGESVDAIAARAGRTMTERRGRDLGGRERQDIDNARRVALEYDE